MASITGGCLCGRVRYTAAGEPAFSGICHCRNCQRCTGSAFETVIAFPTASVSVQGELTPYNDADASALLSDLRVGRDRRGRCHAGSYDIAGGHLG